jgi:hypothetical protein
MSSTVWGGFSAAVAMTAALTACSAEQTVADGPGGQEAAAAVPATFPDPAPAGPVRPNEAFVQGPDNIDTIDVSVEADGGTPDGIRITFDKVSRTATGEKPSAAHRYVFLFDRTVEFTPEAFPTCERAVLESQGVGGCPEGSQVGSGRLDNYPSGSVDVAVFNTRYANGLRGVLITVPTAGIVLENTFEPVTEAYLGKFAYSSDEILPPNTTPPAERSGAIRFQVTFGATRRDGDRVYSFARSTAAPGTPLQFAQWSQFVTGQVIQPEDAAPRP